MFTLQDCTFNMHGTVWISKPGCMPIGLLAFVLRPDCKIKLFPNQRDMSVNSTCWLWSLSSWRCVLIFRNFIGKYDKNNTTLLICNFNSNSVTGLIITLHLTNTINHTNFITLLKSLLKYGYINNNECVQIFHSPSQWKQKHPSYCGWRQLWSFPSVN